jgi:hypothetical protein
MSGAALVWTKDEVQRKFGGMDPRDIDYRHIHTNDAFFEGKTKE